jgi:DNA-binding CsgD family transcriptional regulator
MVLGRMRDRVDAAPATGRGPSGEMAEPLTVRESDVLHLLSRGYTYAECADRLCISVHTVTSHIKNSYRKLAVHSAAEAVTRAAELHMLRDRGSR